jgi:hypothetical protein
VLSHLALDTPTRVTLIQRLDAHTCGESLRVLQSAPTLLL